MPVSWQTLHFSSLDTWLTTQYPFNGKNSLFEDLFWQKMDDKQKETKLPGAVPQLLNASGLVFLHWGGGLVADLLYNCYSCGMIQYTEYLIARLFKL